jgi:hypothetical protein
MQHTVGKLSTRSITLLQTSSQSEVYTKKLWGPKVVGVPTLEISRLPFGSPRKKCHLNVGLVEGHKVYYKGEGGDFPQSPPPSLGHGKSCEFEFAHGSS